MIKLNLKSIGIAIEYWDDLESTASFTYKLLNIHETE